MSLCTAHSLPLSISTSYLSVKNNFVRKKNLEAGKAYTFRVRAREKVDWGSYTEPVTLQVIHHLDDDDGDNRCTVHCHHRAYVLILL